MWSCRSVRPSVGPSVLRSVRPFTMSFKNFQFPEIRKVGSHGPAFKLNKTFMEEKMEILGGPLPISKVKVFFIAISGNKQR